MAETSSAHRAVHGDSTDIAEITAHYDPFDIETAPCKWAVLAISDNARTAALLTNQTMLG